MSNEWRLTSSTRVQQRCKQCCNVTMYRRRVCIPWKVVVLPDILVRFSSGDICVVWLVNLTIYLVLLSKGFYMNGENIHKRLSLILRYFNWFFKFSFLVKMNLLKYKNCIGIVSILQSMIQKHVLLFWHITLSNYVFRYTCVNSAISCHLYYFIHKKYNEHTNIAKCHILEMVVWISKRQKVLHPNFF